MILLHFGLGEVRELVEEVERLGEPFAVRPVGAEQDALDADEVGELAEVLLVVRRDPHVAADRLERILREDPRRLVRLLAQPLHEQRHPVGAVLDARDAQVRVALEHAVDHERRDRVVDRAVGHEDLRERVAVAEAERVAAAPRRREAVVPAVAEMEGDRHRRFREPRPHGVVRACRRANATRPLAAGTGAGRMCTMRAPRSISESTSASAASGSASDIIGAAISRS